MEVKKSEKADLENKKVLFLEIGLVIALSIMIFAFEYRSFDKGDEEQVIKRDDVAIENIDIPQTENTPPPPPEDIPPAEPTEFVIVDESVHVDNSFDITKMFSDQTNTGVIINKKDITNADALAEEDEIFIVVETQASFPLPEGLDAYLFKNIVYPEAARQAGIEGQVSVNFVVEKDGSITNIKIIRDIGGGCGEELVRVLKAMPKWKPAMQRGKAVRNQFGKNVRFGLSGN
ncbi:MAG: energy transducer TonB [Bacteroidales bacterium]|jgi:protein TonB|nr:energy transducer TonB [Bacteroidales bacterium]